MPLKLLIKACRFETLKSSIDKAIEEEQSSPLQSTFVKSNTPRKNQNVCTYCKKMGHVYDECYNRPNKNTSTFNNNNNNNYKINNNSTNPRRFHHFNVVSCAYCKRRGHIISDCRILKC